MDKNIRISYAIFATTFGKGYGCFAIKHEPNSKIYHVSASFCNPIDRQKFSKQIARHRALSRLQSQSWTIAIESEQHNFSEIIKQAIKQSPRSPSWAVKAVENNRYFHTLTKDCKTLESICE